MAAVEGSVNSRIVVVGLTLPLAWRKNTPAVPEWFSSAAFLMLTQDFVGVPKIIIKIMLVTTLAHIAHNYYIVCISVPLILEISLDSFCFSIQLLIRRKYSYTKDKLNQTCRLAKRKTTFCYENV